MFKANFFKHKRNRHLLRPAEDLSSVSIGSVISVSGLISLCYLSTPKQGSINAPVGYYNSSCSRAVICDHRWCLGQKVLLVKVFSTYCNM